MRSSLVMSLIGAASMAVALLVGCGDNDAKPVSSQAGQSCVRTADCADGLSCIQNVCYKTAPPTGGEAGDKSTPPAMPPVLGGEGESCTSRLDCMTNLGCFNNRCTMAAMGEGGATGTGIELGARGESCRVNGDCAKDLVCIPTSAIAGTGICDVKDYGLKPTGMTCGGECLADSDCYQLPIALHEPDIRSCEDLAASIKTDAIDCAAPAVAGKLHCFELATYCGYVAKTSKTWTCDKDSNRCVYNTACVVAANQDAPTGCPTYSRLNTLVPTPGSGLTCNPDSKKCVGPSAVASCTSDLKCEGKQVSDSAVTDLCTAGECTCYTGNKQCYRKCARDIDCGGGLMCDTKIKLCVPSGTCDNDAQCAVAGGSLAYVCKDHACAQTCKSDRECSPTGISGPGNGGAFNGKVCGADGYCASLALECTPDTQCPLAPGGLKTFCVAKPAAAGTQVSSAITD